MTRFSVFIATSLDGFIARDDGGIDWLDRVALPDEDYGFSAYFATVDTLVIGRGTYDTALGFASWPYAGKRVVVMTRRPTESRHGEIFVSGTPLEVREILERAGAEHAYVDGGVVIRQFLTWGLLAEVTISIVPILLGSGLRLFDRLRTPFRSAARPGEAGPCDRDDSEHALELIASRSWSTGLVQVHYRLSGSRA